MLRTSRLKSREQQRRVCSVQHFARLSSTIAAGEIRVMDTGCVWIDGAWFRIFVTVMDPRK